jgi:hypothetical protein
MIAIITRLKSESEMVGRGLPTSELCVGGKSKMQEFIAVLLFFVTGFCFYVASVTAKRGVPKQDSV